MDKSDDLHHRFKDFLQETPEAEEALRTYRRKQAMAAVAKKLREKNQTVIEEAYEWWIERRRMGKPPHGKD